MTKLFPSRPAFCKLPTKDPPDPTAPKAIEPRSLMKRCPECQFLYEDEQECCDMDGTVLRATSFLPPLAPRQLKPTDALKSVWAGFTIPLLALVVIGSVLVTLYRATPPKLGSSSAPKNQPAGTNQDTKLPVSDSPQMVTTPAIPAQSAEPSPSLVPAKRAQNTAAKSTGRDPFSNEERLTIEPATRVQMEPPPPVISAPKPAPSQTSPPPPASQKAAATANTSVHPAPPPAKPTPQSKTQNQDKDSKFKSLFKKAGRVLKKPF